MGSHALVLNASFEPLNVVSWQRAIQLLFQGKVEVIEESDRTIRTVSLTIRIPAVLRLIEFVPLAKRKNIVRFSRANIFLRDQFRCQYCSGRFNRSELTLDHVLPVSQKGAKSWENIVTSCRPCNQKKGGLTPQQAGMRLIRSPVRPAWLPSASFTFGVSRVPAAWRIYFRIETEK